MKTIDCKQFEIVDSRIDAEIPRIDAVDYRNDAADSRKHADASKVVINNNLAQININAIVLDSGSYHNGHFIPVFQDAIIAIACDSSVKSGTLRVLFYILGKVDEHNNICLEVADIVNSLATSDDTVYRAIKQLTDMQVICRKAGARARSLYTLSDKILNPRVAYKGNTRKLKKDSLPLLLTPDGEHPLIPSDFPSPDF